MAKKLIPVSIAGIEFDALLDETSSYSASVPSYPIESGFPVSDTIILDPLSLSMNLYLSNTPVTWLYRHGNDTTRVRKVCEQIEEMWFNKELVKVVTPDKIYTNMGITSLSIKKSQDNGYSRQISISLTKVEITEKKLVLIPSDLLKSGETMSNAGVAVTSNTSSKASSAGATRRSQRTETASSKKDEAKKQEGLTKLSEVRKASGSSYTFGAMNTNSLTVKSSANKLFGSAMGSNLNLSNKSKSSVGGGVR